MHSSKGFTLIELLVVISIISVLSSIILTNINISRSKANDVRRQGEINQVENALELMLSSNNHFACHYYQKDRNDDGTPNTDFLKAYVDAGFLTTTPHDPASGYYVYEYATYKSSPNPTRCGDGVFLGVYYENAGFHCPNFGFIATDGVNHCHIWYPAPPACPGFNPNLGPLANFDPGGPCADYGDPASQNEY
jgi:prepilin-type N-terminal cleavage/methylation domain-containing protein